VAAGSGDWWFGPTILRMDMNDAGKEKYTNYECSQK